MDFFEMGIQLVLLPKGPVTLRTSKRFFACMNPHVLVQIPLLLKSFSTFFTFVLFYSCNLDQNNLFTFCNKVKIKNLNKSIKLLPKCFVLMCLHTSLEGLDFDSYGQYGHFHFPLSNLMGSNMFWASTGFSFSAFSAFGAGAFSSSADSRKMYNKSKLTLGPAYSSKTDCENF